ncbi:PEGA domain-containing protein [Sorangium sp. So ce269]
MSLRRSASIASLFAVLAWSPSGLARPPEQPRAAVTAAMTEESRKLFLNGVQAASESRWEAAHAMFLAARALHPHYTIDGNLGACELQMGRYRDAAENLARYVRELKKDATSTAEERAQAEAGYAKARAKVGAVVLQANVEHAAVLVDGVQVGRTPLADPLFVEPGKHAVAVEREGYITEEFTVDVAAGKEIASTVTLRKPVQSSPVSTPAPVDAAEAQAPVGPVEPRASSPKTALLIGGAATAGAAAVAGVVFTVVASATGNDAEELRDSVVRDHGAAACSRANAPAEACIDVKDAFDVHRRWTNAAFWSFVGAGAIGAGTLIYGLTAKPSKQEGRVVITPLVGANSVGISVAGAL